MAAPYCGYWSERPVPACWVVLSATDEREREAQASAEAFLQEAAEVTATVERFRESYFPYLGAAIMTSSTSLRTGVEPDLVFVPTATTNTRITASSPSWWNTFRNHLIAEYEIPKYEGTWASPTCSCAYPEPSPIASSRCCSNTFLRNSENTGFEARRSPASWRAASRPGRSWPKPFTCANW